MVLTSILLLVSTILIVLLWRALRQHQKNRLKFVAALHDLKTPVSIIQLHSETLSSNFTSEAEQKRCLQTLMSAAGRLSNSVEGLSSMLHSEGSDKHDSFSYDDLLSVATKSIEPYLEHLRLRGFTIETDIEDKPLFTYFDGVAACRAILNLLDNARKYSGPAKWIGFRVREEGMEIRVEVRDRGIGIPKRHYKKIFSMFSREEDSSIHAQGQGIGLAIAKKVMTRHGGRIECESIPGSGSRFSLFFPIRNRPSPLHMLSVSDVVDNCTHALRMSLASILQGR